MPNESMDVVTGFIDGAAGSGSTALANERAWSHWSIVPRLLDPRHETGFGETTTGVTMLGDLHLAIPLGVCPAGGQALFAPDGDIALARACARERICYVAAHATKAALPLIGDITGGFIQQLYLPDTVQQALPFLDYAKQAGARAVMLTIDETGSLPSEPFRAAARPLLDAIADNPDNPVRQRSGTRPRWIEAHVIEELVAEAGVPVIVKGITHPGDAAAALAAGAAGVVVSNHGGRQIDGAITSAEALGWIVDELQDRSTTSRAEIYVDGGIRSASDVFRARALGARVAFIGRPVYRALRAGGESAVGTLLSRWREDFERLLANSGAQHTDRIDRGYLRATKVWA